MIFMKCDVSFTDITDLNEWTTKITANEVHASGQLLASKPQGSFTKKKVASCQVEKSSNATKQIDFQDYNTDNTAFAVHAFWNTFIDNPGKWQLGWITCDGLFYGWQTDFDIEVDEQIEEDVLGNSFIAGSLFYNRLNMTVPQDITGLSGVLG